MKSQISSQELILTNERGKQKKGKGTERAFQDGKAAPQKSCWLLSSLTLCNPKCAIPSPPILSVFSAVSGYDHHRRPGSHCSYVHIPSWEASSRRKKEVWDKRWHAFRNRDPSKNAKTGRPRLSQILERQEEHSKEQLAKGNIYFSRYLLWPWT